jgi:hypothetical protein
VGNAGAAGHFAEGESGGAHFGDDADGALEERFAEVAVMVGAAFHRCEKEYDTMLTNATSRG